MSCTVKPLKPEHIRDLPCRSGFLQFKYQKLVSTGILRMGNRSSCRREPDGISNTTKRSVLNGVCNNFFQFPFSTAALDLIGYLGTFKKGNNGQPSFPSRDGCCVRASLKITRPSLSLYWNAWLPSVLFILSLNLLWQIKRNKSTIKC